MQFPLKVDNFGRKVGSKFGDIYAVVTVSSSMRFHPLFMYKEESADSGM